MWFLRRRVRHETESQQAIVNATKKLREVRDRDDEVHQISGALKSIRERNHFAEQLRVIMERG